MASVKPETMAGGGAVLGAEENKTVKIHSEPLLDELKEIYKKVKGSNSNLTNADFRNFLLKTQGEAPPAPGDASALESWMHKYFGQTDARKLLSSDADITFEEFQAFLGAPGNTALAPAKSQDLTHPLTSYFISSSHNTYLVGHQLYGTSTTDGYINVLRRGCRCIEIDVWDGDDGEPDVFHGYTLTKEIRFKDVCDAIAKHAFDVTELPVIISLECHAGLEQQSKMVDIMKKSWGDMLVDEFIAGDLAKGALPSPNDLRKKILVKVKYLPPDAADPSIDPSKPRESKETYVLDSSPSEDEGEDTQGQTAASGEQKKKKKHKAKVGKALSSLGVYTASHSFKDSFADDSAKNPSHVFSFSEKVFNSLHQVHADEIFEHNMSYMMRVYPFGLRFGSSNPDPTPFWRRGVQLVALNWQKVDEGAMLNEGMFAGEGGYVLKPPSHLSKSIKKIDDVAKILNLKITILAGQDLPLPEKDDKPKSFEPYVKVELHVDGQDELKDKTKAKKGVNVAWGEKKGLIEFTNVKNVIEKLTFVRFKVYDEEFGRDDLSSWSCIRIDRLQSGYRFLHLIDRHGKDSKGVLLLKIEKKLEVSY